MFCLIKRIVGHGSTTTDEELIGVNKAMKVTELFDTHRLASSKYQLKFKISKLKRMKLNLANRKFCYKANLKARQAKLKKAQKKVLTKEKASQGRSRSKP